MEQELLPLKVSRIERPTADSAHIFFDTTVSLVPAYQAGQFLTLLLPDAGPLPIRRSYSLASAPGVDDQLSICVKRTVNGQASAYLTKRLQVGDTLQSLPPAGQFVLPQAPRPLLLIAGGSGFVPVFSLLKAALAGHASTPVQLLLANRNARSVFFREALAGLENAYPDRLRVLHLLSQPTAHCEKQLRATEKTAVKSGRMSNAWLEFWTEQALGSNLQQAHAYLCGPPGLMLKAAMTLRFLGFGQGRLHQEDFIVHAPFRPKADQLPEATVELRYKGKAFSFPVEPGRTLLEGASAAGIQLPYSCRSGSCTTCAAQLTGGRVEMYTHSSRVDSEATNGHIFTCVAYPVTPRVQLTV